MSCFSARLSSTILLCLSIFLTSVAFSQIQSVPNALIFDNPQASDQDDMCIWISSVPDQSTVISSDKSARKVFVYDLQGNVLQTLSMTGKPRNIDVRYNFLLSGKRVDIVAFGQDDSELHFYIVDPSTRRLIEAGSYITGMKSIYGFCLYHNPTTDKFYAMASVNNGSGELRQWELIDNGDGTIGKILKRTWINGVAGLTEGLVADDETGKLYTANENNGIYKFDADPTSANPPGTLVTSVGENGLTADIEGLTIYYAANNNGYLIASSQGSSTFNVYERRAPNVFVKTFKVSSVSGTDGIDVTNVSLGSAFPKGLFIAHDGRRSYGVNYENLGLLVDTNYWNPRFNSTADLMAPASVTAFSISKDDAQGKSVTAAWAGNSSGDDGTTGTISSFEIRWSSTSNGAINSDAKWGSATPCFSGDAAAFALGSVKIDMSSFSAGEKSFAIRTKDDAGNISPLGSGSYTSVTNINQSSPIKGFILNQNYPNPFNPTTYIKYTIGGLQVSPVLVRIAVYNALGQEIQQVVDKKQPAGNYSVQFDASGLPSGVYFYRIEAGLFADAKKMLLIE